MDSTDLLGRSRDKLHDQTLPQVASFTFRHKLREDIIYDFQGQKFQPPLEGHLLLKFSSRRREGGPPVETLD